MKRPIMALILSLFAATALAVAAEAQDTQQFVRYEQGGEISWGELEGETIHQLSEAPYLDGMRTGATVQRSAVTLKAPVEPRQIFMTAFNFLSHISGEPAEYPGIFLVPPSSIAGPEDDIIRPADSQNLHYEAEMVGVVGCVAENLTEAEAEACLFGVSAGNDVSERAWQGADIQWTRAKGSRTFNVVGPVLVRGLDHNNLQITGRLNGEEVQGENSSDLLYNLPYMIHYISQYITLYPGDLVWTGTMGSTRAMEPGDVYEVTIEGVGTLSNEVVQGN